MRIGTILALIAASHVAIGGVLYRDVLSTLSAEGWLNTVGDRGDRAAALWFIVTGVVVGILGACLRELEARAQALPSVLPAGLVLLTACVVIPMPSSGGWAFLPVAWLAYRRSRFRAPAVAQLASERT